MFFSSHIFNEKLIFCFILVKFIKTVGKRKLINIQERQSVQIHQGFICIKD